MKIVISSGHGEHVAGARGIIDEVTEARKVVARVAEILRKSGADVEEYHDGVSRNAVENINAIVAFHNTFERDLDVSVHFNAVASEREEAIGTEVLYTTEKELAERVSLQIAQAGGFIDRGAKRNTNLGFLNRTTAPAVLIEVCFVNSRADVRLYKIFFEQICQAIAGSLIGAEPSAPGPELTPITGQPIATAAQMTAYIKRINPSAPDLAGVYLAEGAAEGVRGDVAFAQACLETGNFRYAGSAVTPDQHNYAGMGVLKNGEKGLSFPTEKIGVRAQVQHLKAYANDRPLAQKCESPRFGLVQRGVAPFVEWLGAQENPQQKGWAAGAGYGAKILSILDAIYKTDAAEAVPEEQHWAEPFWTALNEAGITIHDERFDDKLTRGEAFALLAQIVKAAPAAGEKS